MTPGTSSQSEAKAVRIPPALRHSAALRLVPADASDRNDAARRLVAGARAAGIDFGSSFGTIQPAIAGRPAWVRHVVLAVVGSGRTAMAYQGASRGAETRDEHAERVACLQAAAQSLAERTEIGPDGERRAAVCVFQALLGPDETDAIRAVNDAGFEHVGDLFYMKRAVDRRDGTIAVSSPAGIEIRPVAAIERGSVDRSMLISVLEASYRDTLDCPELCGIRESEDVLESHAATGQFDPNLWFLAFESGRPVGCALFGFIPENRSSELVYLGLAPEVRGRGLGKELLRCGIREVALRTNAQDMLCAVDQRNEPALKLYGASGFREFSTRQAYVKRIGKPS